MSASATARGCSSDARRRSRKICIAHGSRSYPLRSIPLFVEVAENSEVFNAFRSKPRQRRICHAVRLSITGATKRRLFEEDPGEAKRPEEWLVGEAGAVGCHLGYLSRGKVTTQLFPVQKRKRGNFSLELQGLCLTTVQYTVFWTQWDKYESISIAIACRYGSSTAALQKLDPKAGLH